MVDVLAGGALAALLFGGAWAWPATVDLPRTILGLLAQPGVPAAAYPPQLRVHVPGPGPYWATVTGLAAAQILAAAFAGAYLHTRRARPGLARRADIRQAMTGADAGTPIGTYLGLPVRLRAEDSALVVAPARAGKTTRIAVGRIIDAPGPVVATSTKADLVQLTAHTTRAGGRSHVFDPDRLLGWPTPCRWDAVAGCHDVREALTRARAMVAARPLRGDRNASFFEGASETVLRCFAARRRPRTPVHARRARLGPRLHRRHPVPRSCAPTPPPRPAGSKTCAPTAGPAHPKPSPPPP